MAALIRQANSGYELANKPKIKTYGGREERENKTTTTTTNKHFLKRKRRQEISVSNVSDKGRIHVIRVHDTTHLAVTTTLRGSRRSRDYPPHSYIVNERYILRNKRS